MKCSLGISDFLEEIPSLSHSVVFLYFFALITEEGFLMQRQGSHVSMRVARGSARLMVWEWGEGEATR